MRILLYVVMAAVLFIGVWHAVVARADRTGVSYERIHILRNGFPFTVDTFDVFKNGDERIRYDGLFGSYYEVTYRDECSCISWFKKRNTELLYVGLKGGTGDPNAYLYFLEGDYIVISGEEAGKQLKEAKEIRQKFHERFKKFMVNE